MQAQESPLNQDVNVDAAEGQSSVDSPPSGNSSEDSSEVTATRPRRERANELTVVGIGASAGGVWALQSFFENAPVDSGSAYVVVLHLSPEHESRLAEVIGQVTAMPTQQVTGTVPLQPNHIYVIPPSKHIIMEDSLLRLTEPEPVRGRRVAIDLFFRTLADTHGPQATAVVLSGAGADGTLGIKQIKEVGGLTIAQEPTEAEHDAMPRSAISTGMVDYVLPARDIPGRIKESWDTSRRMRLPAEAAPSPEQVEEGILTEAALRDIIAQVRTQTGHDFSNYKRATVLRRIGRRLQINGCENLPDYLDYLRQHPGEVNDLVGDLLISVTQFFRDPEAWAAVERDVLPILFEGKGPQETLRAWVCGCATGEEAYTVSILLHEVASRRERPPQIQVFATDMDADAIGAARLGMYPETISADIGPERLRRWFVRHNGRYQVKKEVRESVLFATHDLLRDTPFSRLDLITCRNLLIYLTRDAQEQVFETFHFALRPEGRLMLGPSEAVDGSSSLFSVSDKQHRVYTRRPVARPVPIVPVSPGQAMVAGRSRYEGNSPMPVLPQESTLTVGGMRNVERTGSLAELHRNLLELYAPPSVLINAEQEVIHLSDSAGRFLRLGGGEPTSNLLRLVLPSLRIELRAALFASQSEGREQTRMVNALLDDTAPRRIRLTVRPVQAPEGARGFALVLFEELPDGGQAPTVPEAEGSAALPPTTFTSDVAGHLEKQIASLQSQLLSTVEQYEASAEELKASNEELQAMNEELRSAAEELETSKEELQSVNEELTTVNQELKSRMEEVSRTNGDLQNLLASTDIGTLFMDRALCVQRYTPAITSLFNIIPTDAGRPFAHLTHQLDTDLLPDAERVLEQLTPVECEVRSTDGRYFLARLRPYRTPEDRIDGVVIVFLDITERRRSEQALQQSEERFRLLVENAREYAMFLMDRDGRIVTWSTGAERVLGWSEKEAIGQLGEMIFTPEDRQAGAPEHEMRGATAKGSQSDVRWHVRKDGSRLWADGVLTRLDGTEGKMRGYAKILRDATDRKQREESDRQTKDTLEKRVQERTEQLAEMSRRREDLMRQQITGLEAERQRISRELHDETGQDLTVLLLGLKAIQDANNLPPLAKETIPRLQKITDGLARKVHRLAVALRPTALDDLGLASAVQTYADDWSEQSGIPAQVEVVGNLHDPRLPAEVETVVYRVVQEALTNVLRHARGATSVSVLLQRDGSFIQAIVEDNGAGFEANGDEEASVGAKGTKPGRPRLGVEGMRERAALVNGTITLESAPEQGTTVFLRIPLAKD